MPPDNPATAPPAGAATPFRQRAEGLVAQQEQKPAATDTDLSIDQARQLIHELKVHQVELALQNEALQHLHDALDTERARYFELYELAPIGYCVITDKGLIQQANLTLVNQLGVARTQLINQPFSQFVIPDDQASYYRLRRDLQRESTRQVVDLRLGQADGATFWARLEAMPASEADGTPITRLVISDISAQKATAAALAREQARLAHIIDSTKVGSWEWDIQTGHLQVNSHWAKMLGYTLAELEPVRIETWLHWLHTDDLGAWLNTLFGHFGQAREDYTVEYRLRHRQGHWVWVLDRGRVTRWTDGGEPWMMHGFRADVSERKRVEAALRANEQFLNSIYQGAQIGIFVIDYTPSGQCYYVGCNPFLARQLNLPPTVAEATTPEEVWPSTQAHTFTKHLNACWQAGEPVTFEHPLGEESFWEVTLHPLYDEQGRVYRIVGTSQDITARKRYAEELEHTAQFDPLTDLPNRRLFADRLDQAMHQARRHGQHLAVVFIDLDGFKAINDQHSHGVGDQLLVKLARRMRQALRTEDTLARIGGDEFIALLMDIDTLDGTVPWLERLLAAAAQPVVIGQQHLQVSASLGVSCYPQAVPVTADQLLQQADQAMYQAKLKGKHRYWFFASDRRPISGFE